MNSSSLNIETLRLEIAAIAPTLGIHPFALTRVPGLGEDVSLLEHAISRLAPRQSRTGNVDILVNQTLQALEIRSIYDEPKLLSAIGILVDAETCLGVLQVQSDYNRHIGVEKTLLGYNLMAGYRPHTDILRELPRSYYVRPKYVAPAEDLLDYFAVDFYAGQRAGDSEDGAVGWLLHTLLRDMDHPSEGLETLARECSHWSTERLAECLEVWQEIVGPALLKPSPDS